MGIQVINPLVSLLIVEISRYTEKLIRERICLIITVKLHVLYVGVV
tara:strand:+ start:574 stop:711 length:138 start_codon:yes stop_codon:yes gene_type:complete